MADKLKAEKLAAARKKVNHKIYFRIEKQNKKYILV